MDTKQNHKRLKHKGCMASGGNPAQFSKRKLPPSGRIMWEVFNPLGNQFLMRDSAPKVLPGGWSRRQPQVRKFQTPKGKQMFSRNHSACTMSQCYVEKVLCQCGNCLPVRASDASQGRADLSKDSGLRPALLALLCTTLWPLLRLIVRGRPVVAVLILVWRRAEVSSVPPSQLHFFPLFSEIVYIYFEMQLKFLSVVFHTKAPALA